jgi:hypothetical protein
LDGALIFINVFLNAIFLQVIPRTVNGDLALQVGGVPDEAITYGYEFCATRTIE